MIGEETLRSYAAQEHATPTHLLAEDVVFTARRRIRNGRIRMVAAAGIATALVLVGVAVAAPDRHRQEPAVTPSAPPLVCTAEVLTGAKGLVAAIDPSGRYIVGRYASSTDTTGLTIWTDGVVSQPASAKSFDAVAVNVHGDIVGTVEGNDLPRHNGSTESLPVLWPAAGGYRMLETGRAEWWQHTADAISDDGVILGSVLVSRDVDTFPRPYRWNPDSTSGPLPIPRPEENEATDMIGMAGPWAVGLAGPLPFKLRPTPSPGVQDLQTLNAYVRWNLVSGGLDELGMFAPMAVSATGVMIGMDQANDRRPAVWRGGTLTPLPLPDPKRRFPVLAGISADGSTAVATMWEPQEGDIRGPYDMVRWTCPTTP